MNPLERILKILPALLKSQGIAFDFSQAEPSPEAFEPIGAAASLPGAKLLLIRGGLKDGTTLAGVLIANQTSKPSAEISTQGA